MGYDYRGGGVPTSPFMAQAIKALRAGTTRSQLDRAFMDKALGVGAQTMVSHLGHTIEGNDSRELQKNQHNAEVMRGAIADQSARAAEGRETAKYSTPNAGRDQANAMSMDHAVMAGRAPVPGAGHVTDPSWLSPLPDIKAQASEAKDTQDMNAGASEAAIGGYRTPGASDTVDNESDVRAADVNTGRNLMRMGGMMNSLPRSR